MEAKGKAGGHLGYKAGEKFVIKSLNMSQKNSSRRLDNRREERRFSVGKAETALTIPLMETDSQAFTRIYADYYVTVFGIARRILGSPEEAEEVAQETFIKLYRLWPNLAIDTSLRSWLAKVAINLSISRYRAQNRSSALSERLKNQKTENVESAESEVIAALEAEKVARALSMLKKRDRACLVARHSGLSYQEVADVLGLRPASVGKILQRAEAKLKDAYLMIRG